MSRKINNADDRRPNKCTFKNMSYAMYKNAIQDIGEGASILAAEYED